MAIPGKTSPQPAGDTAGEPAGLSKAVVFLFALACGATTANIYYAQSIAGPIAESLHLPISLSGLVVTTTQLGYGLGLFFLVSLADLVENRLLVLVTTTGTVLSLVWLACTHSAAGFFIGSLALGIFAVGSQILIPLAVHLSPEKQRGQVIGSLMGGLVTGIMLSRPLSSFLASRWDWRAIFVVSAVAMLGLLVLLARSLPTWKPRPGRSYPATLASTARLMMTVRPLQRRAAYQGTLFAVFNMFWTAGPLMLRDRFGFGKVGIAVFALAGAAGALTAPVAGKIADRGGGKIGTGTAMLSGAAAMAISAWAQNIGSVIVLAGAAILLDGAVQANQVFGQRVVQSIDAEARGRLNAAYMTVLFLCGAAGSTLGSVTYFHGGWRLTAGVGAALALVIFLVFLTEQRQPHRSDR